MFLRLGAGVLAVLLMAGCATTAEICPTPEARYTCLAADGTNTAECACVRPVTEDLGWWGVLLDAIGGYTGPYGSHR